MSQKKETGLASTRIGRDPFALLREVTSQFDRVFDRPFGAPFRVPFLPALGRDEATAWSPEIEVFERDNRLVTKVDLPGMKKEDVNVEIADGHLAISGERKSETEETKDNVYRCERSYGSFYRAVPLPEGAKTDDVKATFADGVLEVSVGLAARVENKAKKIEIQGAAAPEVAGV